MDQLTAKFYNFVNNLLSTPYRYLYKKKNPVQQSPNDKNAISLNCFTTISFFKMTKFLVC